MAAEEIGNLIPTKIPGYSDDADVQAALRLYHYGSYDYIPSNTSPVNLVSPSIAKTIYDIQQNVLSLDAVKISNNIFTAKGQILSATASNSPTVLNLGTNNQFLVANSSTGTGLEWTNTLTAPTILSSTITSPIITLGKTTPVFSSNSYTITLLDQYKFVLCSNGTTAGTVYIPTNLVAFPIGTQVTIVQTGTGQITITATSSGTTTINSAGLVSTSPKIRTQYSLATCLKIDTETWIVMGDIV